MKIYVLTVTKERCFGNGSKIVVDDVYLGAFNGLEIAKDFIYDVMKRANDFRRVSASEQSGREVVFIARYEDRYSVGDSNTYYIRELDFSVPEVKENEDLKKRVKDLEKKLDELKTRLNSLTSESAFTTKEGFHTEPVEKKETKSHVKFW